MRSVVAITRRKAPGTENARIARGSMAEQIVHTLTPVDLTLLGGIMELWFVRLADLDGVISHVAANSERARIVTPSTPEMIRAIAVSDLGDVIHQLGVLTKGHWSEADLVALQLLIDIGDV